MDRRNLLKAVTLAGSALAVPTLVAPALADDKAATAPWIEKFAATLSAHDLTAFAALFSENYVNHQVSAASPPPPAGKSPKQGTVGVLPHDWREYRTSRWRSRPRSIPAILRPQASSIAAPITAHSRELRPPVVRSDSLPAIFSGFKTA
jgi:hypothetical protein